MAKDSKLETIFPFFIVKNLEDSIAFYNQKLGFETDVIFPEENPFLAIVLRDDVRFLLKHIAEDIPPVPNPTRHDEAPWDVFVRCSNPDALFSEFESRGVQFHVPLKDNAYGLRAFEVKDADGYVLCFGASL